MSFADFVQVVIATAIGSMFGVAVGIFLGFKLVSELLKFTGEGSREITFQESSILSTTADELYFESPDRSVRFVIPVRLMRLFVDAILAAEAESERLRFTDGD